MEPRRIQHSAGLCCGTADICRAAQLLHPLPGPDQQGDAGAVHKGHAGEIQRQLCRQGLLNLLIQPPQEPLSAVVVQLPNFKYTADADKRNTFDIEAFLSARLKLKPDEVCDVYEVDTEGV